VAGLPPGVGYRRPGACEPRVGERGAPPQLCGQLVGTTNKNAQTARVQKQVLLNPENDKADLKSCFRS